MRSKDPEQLLGALPETRKDILAFARALDAEQRTDEAIRLLEKASLRSPSPPLRKALAALYQKTERLDDCIAILSDILEKHPDDVPSLLLLTEAQIDAGKLDDAKASRTRLKELDVSRKGLLQLGLKLQKAKAARPKDVEPDEQTDEQTDEDVEEFLSRLPDSGGGSRQTMMGMAPAAQPEDSEPEDDALDIDPVVSSLAEESVDLDIFEDENFTSFFDVPEELEAVEPDAPEPEPEQDGDGDDREQDESFYVGPTRADLSAGDERIKNLFRRDVSERTAQTGVPRPAEVAPTMEDPDEPEDESSASPNFDGFLDAETADRLKKSNARGTLIGLPSVNADDDDEDDVASVPAPGPVLGHDADAATTEFEGFDDFEHIEQDERLDELSELEELEEPDEADGFLESGPIDSVNEFEIPTLEDDDVGPPPEAGENRTESLELDDIEEVDSGAFAVFEDVEASEIDVPEPGSSAPGVSESESTSAAPSNALPEQSKPEIPELEQDDDLEEEPAASGAGQEPSEPSELGIESEREPEPVEPPEPEPEPEQVASPEPEQVEPPEPEVGPDATSQISTAANNESSGTSLWLIGGVVLSVLLAGAIWFGVFVLDSLSATLQERVEQSRDQQQSDTYEGYLAATETLAGMSEVTSFAGPKVDGFMSELGLTNEAIEESRDTAATELAVLNAMIEYRYESAGSRDAADAIANARRVAGEDVPRVSAARAFQLMAEGKRDQARKLLEQARLEYSRDRHLATASIELDLADDRAKSADHTADILRESTRDWIYFNYLLGRVDLALEKPTAQDMFRGIIEQPGPEHLWARIDQSYALQLGEAAPDANEQARAMVGPVLGEFSERASPLQKAHAHAALGHLDMMDGATDAAGQHFQKAVELSPARADLHVDLVDFYLETDRLDDALAQIEEADELVGSMDALTWRKAQALEGKGACEKVVSTLDALEAPTYASKLLEARCRFELGDDEAAEKAFSEAAALSSEPPVVAKALELVASARAAKTLDASWIPVMTSLVEKSGDAPEVLRAQSLLTLEFAEVETDKEAQRKLLERAVEASRKAVETRPDWAPGHYTLCRAHMRLGQGEPATTHCARGRELDPTFRSGVATAVKLAILQGNDEAALAVAEELSEAYPDSPYVGFTRVRALVANHRANAAKTELDRWSDTPVASGYEGQMARGLLAFEMGNTREALERFDAARGATRFRAEAEIYYAWAGVRLGQEGGSEILKARLSDPLWTGLAWLGLSELRLKKGEANSARQNYTEALSALRTTIASASRLSQTYAGLAYSWAELQSWDHRLTRRYVSRASTNGDPDSVYAHMISGTYHLEKRRRDLEKAAASFEAVIERAPYHCGAIESLLRVYRDDGNDEAREKVESLEAQYCSPDDQAAAGSE